MVDDSTNDDVDKLNQKISESPRQSEEPIIDEAPLELVGAALDQPTSTRGDQSMSDSLENLNVDLINQQTESIVVFDDELAIVDSILAHQQQKQQQIQQTFVSSTNSNSSQLLVTLDYFNAVSNIYDETDDIVCQSNNDDDSGQESNSDIITSKC
jgi:hypothetical protein